MRTHEPIDQHESLVTDFVGHEVLDEHGLNLGRVTDVVDNLLVVDPGLLRPAHYVPIAGSYHTDDAKIVVPWERHWFKSAPRVNSDHAPSARDLEQLKEHYTGN